jgi:hypothetical protein
MDLAPNRALPRASSRPCLRSPAFCARTGVVATLVLQSYKRYGPGERLPNCPHSLTGWPSRSVRPLGEEVVQTARLVGPAAVEGLGRCGGSPAARRHLAPQHDRRKRQCDRLQQARGEPSARRQASEPACSMVDKLARARPVLTVNVTAPPVMARGRRACGQRQRRPAAAGRPGACQRYPARPLAASW